MDITHRKRATIMFLQSKHKWLFMIFLLSRHILCCKAASNSKRNRVAKMEREHVDEHVKQRPEVTNCWLENVLFAQTKREGWCSGWFFSGAAQTSKVRRTRPRRSSSLQLKWWELDCNGLTNKRNKPMMTVKSLWLLMNTIFVQVYRNLLYGGLKLNF